MRYFFGQSRRAMIALITVAGLLLTACGDSDDASTDDAPSAPATDGGDTNSDDGADDESDGGDVTGGLDTGDARYDIAAPDGATLDPLAAAGLDFEGQRQLYYPSGDFDRVVAFYDEWTSQNGDWTKNESDGAANFVDNNLDVIRSVAIIGNFEAPEGGTVTYVQLLGGPTSSS